MKEVRQIKLVPHATSYEEWIKLTAEAMNNPELLKKTKPNQRVLSLARMADPEELRKEEIDRNMTEAQDLQLISAECPNSKQSKTLRKDALKPQKKN